MPSAVYTDITSSFSINKGTLTTKPVSSSASLVALLVVLPLTASLVSVTSYSTFSGNTIPIISSILDGYLLIMMPLMAIYAIILGFVKGQ